MASYQAPPLTETTSSPYASASGDTPALSTGPTTGYSGTTAPVQQPLWITVDNAELWKEVLAKVPDLQPYGEHGEYWIYQTVSYNAYYYVLKTLVS
jgi:hypothetical protein